jgi:3-deoxy-7-phosphoheptulonate synthase
MEYLPPYEEYKARQRPSLKQHQFIDKSRDTVRAILNRSDPRLLLIVGPCSIHDKISTREYASRLHDFAASVSSQFFLVMRTYFEKSRSVAGWKGFLYDPLLDGSHNIPQGIEWTRELLLELAAMEVPTATEFLDPISAYYYDDLITWGSIGARTSSSQPHRQLASALEMPIGFKNGIAGNVSAAVNGALAASHPHRYMGLCPQGKPIIKKTSGNHDAHVVLRGGESGPNYDPGSVAHLINRLEHVGLPARLLIDCSHQNSGKKFEKQPAVFQSVINQIVEGNTAIRGVMLESHLHSGKQMHPTDVSQLKYGVSITDSCLDWHSTAHLIEWAAVTLQQQQQCAAAEAIDICGIV